jgi:hypothetical protein
MVHSIYLLSVDCFDGYVQPRSRRSKAESGWEFPAAKVKCIRLPRASLILFIRRIFAAILALHFLELVILV